jgi:carboxypeptidase T
MAEYHCHHHTKLDGKPAFSAVDLPIAGFGGGTETKKFQSLKNDLAELRKIGGQKGIVDTSVESVGDSAEGRPLWALKIGHGEKHKVMVNGCHHAREWISVEVPFLLAKYLVENYQKNATDPKLQRIEHLLENRQLLIVPMTNPDGHMFTMTQDRGWRTNRATHALEARKLVAPRLDGKKGRAIEITKGSYLGVDINRNYDEPNWGKETFLPGDDTSAATSRDPSDRDVYCGESAGSEAETKLMQDLQQKEKFRAYVTFHSMGQLLLYPDADSALKSDFLQFVGKGMSALIDEHGNPYTYGQPGKILYPVTGSGMDYAWHVCPGRPAFTPELRPTNKDRATKGHSRLPADEIEPTFAEMLGATLGLINCAGFDQKASKVKVKLGQADPVAQVVRNGLAPFKGWTP